MKKVWIYLFIFIAILNSVMTNKAQKSTIKGRVMGGVDAGAHEFPWMVSIVNRFNFHLCGGSIIDETHILTAAHCFYQPNGKGGFESDRNVVLGSHNISAPLGQPIPYKSFKLHEDFDYALSPFDDDIAIIELGSKIIFDKTIQPISLCSEEPPNDAVVSMLGWGYIELDDGTAYLPDILQKVNLTVISNQKCEEAYNETNGPRVICAGGPPETLKGACNIDSGGPMIYKAAEESKYCLAGIVCFADTVCGKLPTGFTSVPPYLDWIASSMKSTSNLSSCSNKNRPNEKT